MMQTLSPAERARQLSRPEGEVGLAVARWMNEANRAAYAGFIRQLDLAPGARVLELGPGSAAYASDIVALAPAVRYTGLDISPTMVTEAIRLNAELVGRGLVDVRLGAAEWDRLARNAGFGDVAADELAMDLPTPGGAPVTRHVIRPLARV